MSETGKTGNSGITGRNRPGNGPAAKRRERGTGSISGPTREGIFTAAISLGVVDGKRRRVKVEAKSKAEARAKLEELRQRYALVRSGVAIPTLDMYLHSWLARRRVELAPATMRSYDLSAANVRPLLGHVPIDRLTATAIAAALRELGKRVVTDRDRRVQDRPKAATPGRAIETAGERTVQAAYDMLRAALRFAVERDEVLRVSPMRAVPRPRREREVDYLTREEAQAFLAAVSEDRYRALWHLVIATGLRWGEVAGLVWGDVDLAAGTLTIRRALKESRETGATKTKRSRRRIDLPPSIVRELERHRTKRATAADYVFATEDGTALHPSNLTRRHFFPALKRAGLRRVRFHDLRHTAAAIRLGMGQHPLVVKELLGHASITTTMNVYGHLAESVSREAAAGYDAGMTQRTNAVESLSQIVDARL